jgi:large subunit ribosomal protein L18
MSTKDTTRAARVRRHSRVRKRVSGSANRPRLAVFRSNRHIYVQVIDDSRGATLAAASDLEKGGGSGAGKKTEAASEVGKRVAERAKSAGVEEVVFDRGGYKYHGRVKALAEAARKAGLGF